MPSVQPERDGSQKRLCASKHIWDGSNFTCKKTTKLAARRRNYGLKNTKRPKSSNPLFDSNSDSDSEPKSESGACKATESDSDDSDNGDEDEDRPLMVTNGDEISTSDSAGRHKRKREAVALRLGYKESKGPAKVHVLGQRDHEGEEDDEEEKIGIEPFNMRAEMEEGSFGESGNYTRRKDANEIHDTWLVGISKRQILEAAAASKARIANDLEVQSETLKYQNVPNDPPSLQKLLLGFMREHETVSGTLARISKTIQRKPAWRSGAAESASQTESDASRKARDAVDQITEIANRLLTVAQGTIYSQTYKEIIGDLRDEGHVDRSWTPLQQQATPEILWQFRWQRPDGSVDDVIQGPFTSEGMRNWASMNYFDNGILLRQHKSDSSPWKEFRGDANMFDQ